MESTSKWKSKLVLPTPPMKDAELWNSSAVDMYIENAAAELSFLSFLEGWGGAPPPPQTLCGNNSNVFNLRVGGEHENSVQILWTQKACL